MKRRRSILTSKKRLLPKDHYYIIVILLIFSVLFYIGPFFLNFTGLTILESQPNATTGKDTYILNGSGVNFGTQNTLKIGRTAAGRDYKTLIEFNVSSISNSSTITSAVLQLHVVSPGSGMSIELYRVTSFWNQTVANWTVRNSSQSWSTEGGDYDNSLIANVTINTSTNRWYNFTITTLVRNWVNGTQTNRGMILIPAIGVANGNIADIVSSDNTSSPSYSPIITIDYTTNAPPDIQNITVTSLLPKPRNVNENVTFNVSWTDLESNNAQLFVCGNSTINVLTGCANRTLCNTSLASTTPVNCTYTINGSDNRTTNVWIAMCDATNCSNINQTRFHMNHPPGVLVTDPNGNETVNQSLGNYTVRFNVSDNDSDLLVGFIYYDTAQNGTTNAIAVGINLSRYCANINFNVTPNNCSYQWNSTNVFGGYFITVVANDSYTNSSDSSNSSFNVRSLIDTKAPNITGQWIEAVRIYAGRAIQIYANVSEENVISVVFVSVNITPQQNITMTNTTSIQYNATFTAPAPGTYQFKVYANDSSSNLNDSMPWQSFNVTAPNASAQNITVPSRALPLSLIKVTSRLNTSDPLTGVYAFLNLADGFEFLSNYTQNLSMGNYSANQTKTTTWFLSTPLAENATYTLNTTFTDFYSDRYNTTNALVTVTNAIGGYLLDIFGYQRVTRGDTYFVEARFSLAGTYTAPDSITIRILDATGTNFVSTQSMTNNPSTGIYNYSTTIGTSVVEGQWQTIINATKGGLSYYASEFFRVVGGLFDVSNITIVNSATDALEISVLTENKGQGQADLWLTWNLTKSPSGEVLDEGSTTYAVNPGQVVTRTVTGFTTNSYTGAAKITFIGYFGSNNNDKAGASKTFTITAAQGKAGPTGAAVTGGGAGRKLKEIEPKINKSEYDMYIEFDKEISLTKNIKKTVDVTIENIGQKELTNISLKIEGLSDIKYTILPKVIKKLEPDKKETFIIEFLVTDYLGEKELTYIIKTDTIFRTKKAKITVLPIKEFFIQEIKILRSKINELREKLPSEYIGDLAECESLVNSTEDFIEKEQFINAKNSIEKADKCIDKLADKLKFPEKLIEKKAEVIMPNLFLITIWGLIALLVVALVFVLYRIYKKLNILTFFKKEEALEKGKKPDQLDLKGKYFDEKIKEIEEKLFGREEKKVVKRKPKEENSEEESEDQSKENV